MANPLRDLIQKHVNRQALSTAQGLIAGLAQDFWKDGTENPFKKDKTPVSASPRRSAAASVRAAPPSTETAVPEPGRAQEWHAAPGEVLEKMWGEGCVLPGDEVLTAAMLDSLKLDKDMSVLDISAGLGVRLRHIAEKYGATATGLEPDPQIAARGMAMAIASGKGKESAIATYEPATFSVAQNYNAILAREIFYQVGNKENFFKALAAASKPQGGIAFTDYILNPEDRDKPAVKAWLGYEEDPTPLSLVEMAEGWAKAGFTLTTHEDQTDFYRKEILAGMARLAKNLAALPRPDAATKKTILKRTELWTHRMAALEQGLKLFRFHGVKNG